MKLRVPFLNHQRSSESNYKILQISRSLKISFPFGFSSRMIFFLWCICGGFLLHFFESSLLDILLKRNYEKPIDTAEDVLDSGLTIISYPGAESKVNMLKNHPFYITRTLAERTVVPKVLFR